MNQKISVIIPVYNTEKYIENCLMSIVEQTYSNYEIILVNDGSLDNSITIVKKYLKIVIFNIVFWSKKIKELQLLEIMVLLMLQVNGS